MACTTSIQNLKDYLQSVLDNNQDACCQELILPTDVSTYTNDVLNQCDVQTSTITSPVSNCVNRVHNFDIPIHTFCEYLFRGENTNLSSIQTSTLWKDTFQTSNVTPPRIDMLSSTNTDEYYLLKAWISMFLKYIEIAQTVNNNDRLTVDMAHQTINDNQKYLQDQLGALHEHQSHEDVLQDIVDNPLSYGEVLQQNRKKRTHDQWDAKQRGRRSSCRKQNMYVPLHRTKMQSFEHALVDTQFSQEVREWERQLSDACILQHNIEQKRLLVKSIASVLCECKVSLHRIYQLIQNFVEEWKQNILVCNITEMPLMRRMAFQHQLKTSLMDVRALMEQQHVQSNLALCEHVCASARSYYPFFNYTTGSCSPVLACTQNTSISIVRDASNSLSTYTTAQLVLHEMNNAKLQPNAVVTKNELKCILFKLTQWKYSLVLTSA